MEREHNGMLTVYTVQVTDSTWTRPNTERHSSPEQNTKPSELVAMKLGEQVLHLPEPETTEYNQPYERA